ncbi:MAG: helix-turn-helix domain-containing protein [Actinomycetales bacterium]
MQQRNIMKGKERRKAAAMDEQQSQELGHFLRQHREASSVSLRGLAGRVGVDAAQILRLERGDIASPKADLLARIAHELDLPLADVFGLAGYALPSELPSFRPYLRAKYHDLPPAAVAELERVFADVARRYGATDGPLDGEDEH